MKRLLKYIKPINQILLLFMILLAAYEVTVAGYSQQIVAIWAFTVGFGVLVISGLLIIILGNDVLEKTMVVISTTLIPLSLSLGLIAEFIPSATIYYLIFAVTGFTMIVYSRIKPSKRSGAVILVPVHAISGLVIFLLPIILCFSGVTPPGFVWVTIGGSFIGLGGLLLSFLRTGRQILSQDMIFNLLPVLLFVTTLCFVIGFNALK